MKREFLVDELGNHFSLFMIFLFLLSFINVPYFLFAFFFLITSDGQATFYAACCWLAWKIWFHHFYSERIGGAELGGVLCC